jgi:hypothetical protein
MTSMNQQSEPTAATSSRPRRRWYQFSLGMFLVFTTLVTVLLVFVVRRHREVTAIAQIELRGWNYLCTGEDKYVERK